MSEEKIPFALNDATQEALARKYDAEAQVALSEAEYNRAQAHVVLIEAEEARARAALEWAKTNREKADHEKYQIHNEEQLAIVKSKDRMFQKYQFAYPVTNNSVNECMDTLNYWHRSRPKCDMEVVFYSPGGEVISGMRLFDHIRWLISEGHNITTTTMGEAASMGGVLLQSGVTRRMGREASVLIHEIQFVAAGDKGDVDDAVERANMIQRRVVKIFCDRAKATGKSGILTPAMMKRKWRRKDWWLDSEECYKLGIVDVVL